MAKRNDPVARARGRKPAPIKKPFPVGFAIGALVLVLFLGSIITYAVLNVGIGDKSSLKYAQSQIDEIRSVKDLKSAHVPGAVAYPDQASTPPVGGDHNQVPQSCQVYTEAIANENAVHSLEHGAVWITYEPTKASADDVKKLKEMADGDPYRIMSPYPGLKSAISLQAWGEQVFVDKASDSRVEKFLKLFTSGPQPQERGATCVGTTSTGRLQPAPPTGASGASGATGASGASGASGATGASGASGK